MKFMRRWEIFLPEEVGEKSSSQEGLTGMKFPS